jgi:hypothetical protein
MWFLHAFVNYIRSGTSALRARKLRDKMLFERMTRYGDRGVEKASLIEGGRQTMSFTMRGNQYPMLNESVTGMLSSFYGIQWVSDNELLLRAMLAFVEDFHALIDKSAGLTQYFEDAAPECLLLNIFSCLQHAGAYSQPTLRTGEADFGEFMTAFLFGNILTDNEEASVATTLVLATEYGIAFSNRISKAA